jgi:uncharacterized protein (TIRG00374 family)
LILVRISASKIGFFAFGLAAFVYLALRFGLDQIAANIQRAGWSLVTIVLLWMIVYLLNTFAWMLTLGTDGRKIRFGRLFMVTVSGFVINYVTPVVALGGEPYRVSALSESMGTGHSISAVIVYRMVHLLGHMFALLTGIIAALIVLPLPLSVTLSLGAGAVVVCCVIIVTLMGHRHGVFEKLQSGLARIPVVRRFAVLLEKYRSNFKEMDLAITGPYHHARGKFLLAIFLEYVSRICMGFEVYVILRGIGIEVDPASAFFLYVLYSMIINLLFFIPLNLGAREGGLALGLESLSLPPLLGVYLGVVMRIREFFWILLGLSFMLLSVDRKKTSSANAA